MEELKLMRKVNGLSQDILGEYLDMKKSFVSKIENGREKLPKEKLQKLLNNDKGWDVSMLTAPQGNIYNNASGSGTNTNNVNIGNTQALQAKIEMLEQQLAEEKARSSEYWELLKDAIKKSREQ